MKSCYQKSHSLSQFCPYTLPEQSLWQVGVYLEAIYIYSSESCVFHLASMNLKDDSGCLQWVGLCLFVPAWLKQPWGCCSVLAWLTGNDTNILWLQIKLQWKTTYYICVLFMSVEGKLLADFLDPYWGISYIHCKALWWDEFQSTCALGKCYPMGYRTFLWPGGTPCYIGVTPFLPTLTDVLSGTQSPRQLACAHPPLGFPLECSFTH